MTKNSIIPPPDSTPRGHARTKRARASSRCDTTFRDDRIYDRIDARSLYRCVCGQESQGPKESAGKAKPNDHTHTTIERPGGRDKPTLGLIVFCAVPRRLRRSVRKNQKNMCLFPTIIQNPRYKNATPKDQRLAAVKIPCGRCQECRNRKANDWKQRLTEELKYQTAQAYFITLTISDEVMNKYTRELAEDRHNDIIGDLIKKWRKRNYKAKVQERHFFATERGQECTERIHAHGIVFTHDIETISQNWDFGWFDIGKKGVSERSVSYIIKYISKPDEKHDTFTSKIFASKGLGNEFVKKEGARIRNAKLSTYRTPKGYKVALCDYYMKKIYTDEEREEMRIKKMDEHKLYIKGLEYDVSSEKGQREYIKKMNFEQTNCKSYEKPIRNKKKRFASLGIYNITLCENDIKTYETKRGIEEFVRSTLQTTN